MVLLCLVITVLLAGCVSPYPYYFDIIEAAKAGDTRDVKRHLKHDPSRIDGWSGASTAMTPLHAAAEQGRLGTVRYLVAQGARTKVWATGGVYPIHAAAANGHTDVVKFFLDQGLPVDVPGADGTPLHYAARNGRAGLVNFLIQRGADVNKSVYNAPSPLHVAAENGHTDIVRILVRHGAKIDAQDSRSRTPYDLAMRRDHLDTAACLQSLAAIGH